MKKILLLVLALCAACLLQPAGAAAQTQWKKASLNPVFEVGEAGAWDSKNVKTPAIVHDGAIYHMWYDGSNGTKAGIGYATSPDGITWTRHPGPVLEAGPAGAWDFRKVAAASVIFDSGAFHMWYYGDNGTRSGIGYATSPDGITWTRHPASPVMVAGPSSDDFDCYSVEDPSVLRIGGKYKMWYTGYTKDEVASIGYAESDDGLTWSRSANNPLIVPSGKPPAWDGLDVFRPAVVYDGATYHMWYSGCRVLNFFNALFFTFFTIGYTHSSDGTAWEAYGHNPVLRRSGGVFTGWEGRYVQSPAVIIDAGQFKMWYSGFGGWGENQHYQIGYAQSPLPSE